MTYVVLICTTDEICIFIFINGHAPPFECDSPLTPALRAPRALFCSPYKRKKKEKKRKKKKKTDDFASLSSSEAWAPDGVQCMTYHRLSSDELRPKSDMFFSSLFSVVFSWTMIISTFQPTQINHTHPFLFHRIMSETCTFLLQFLKRFTNSFLFDNTF